MNDSLDQLDDLEIYVQGEPLEDIKHWLLQNLPGSELGRESKKGFRLKGVFNNQPVPVTVVKNAGQTGFTSIWVQTRNTPWKNDIEMARAAHKALNTTIRCIESAWQKGDEPDLWYEISDQGERQIIWKTVED